MTSLSIGAAYSSLNYSDSLGTEYNVQAARQQQYKKLYGNDVDFKSMLFMTGKDADAVLQKIEDHIEGGWGGNGIKGDTLSWDRYITGKNNNDDVVFQSASGGTYTNIRFDKGYFSQMGEKQFAYNTGAFGSDLTNKPYDVVKFGQDEAQFIDYKYTGNAIQRTSTINFGAFSNTNWSKNVSYQVKEFNPNYLTIGEPDDHDVEGWKANATFAEMQALESQWLTSSMRSTLSNYSTRDGSYQLAYIAMTQYAFDQEKGYASQWLS